jgi:large subunit ribosomal protein L10e
MGDTTREFDCKIELQNITSKEKKISHNALEAARIAANRFLEEKLEPGNFMLKLVPYPHEIIRKNKRINVPQADRFQEGMRLAYGAPIATAARVERGDLIMYAEVDEANFDVAKEALERADNKLPVSCRIRVEENE